MSEITDIEIKKMTKEQNYLRGYADCKADMIRKAEAKMHELENSECSSGCKCVSVQENCPYMDCIRDIRVFLVLEQLKEQSDVDSR